MTKYKQSASVLLASLALALVGCAKAPPRSTTTTRTQTTTEAGGEKVETDAKETNTVNHDGSETNSRSETTSRPAPSSH